MGFQQFPLKRWSTTHDSITPVLFSSFIIAKLISSQQFLATTYRVLQVDTKSADEFKFQ